MARVRHRFIGTDVAALSLSGMEHSRTSFFTALPLSTSIARFLRSEGPKQCDQTDEASRLLSEAEHELDAIRGDFAKNLLPEPPKNF